MDLSALFNEQIPGIISLFNTHAAGLITGIIGTALVGSSILLFNKLTGQAAIDRNAASIDMFGRVRKSATDAFEKSAKLQSILVEGNDYVYVFLRDKKMAFFDLRNKKQVHAWWKAQRFLNNPQKIYDMARGICTENPKKGTEAYLHWRSVARRNRTWAHPNMITNAGKEVDAAMISQLQGLMNPFEEDSSSGMCHLALKVLDEDKGQHVLVRPTTKVERAVLEDMLEYDDETEVMRLSPTRMHKWIQTHHANNADRKGGRIKITVPRENTAVPA